jgi:hypothetical protein
MSDYTSGYRDGFVDGWKAFQQTLTNKPAPKQEKDVVDIKQPKLTPIEWQNHSDIWNNSNVSKVLNKEL